MLVSKHPEPPPFLTTTICFWLLFFILFLYINLVPNDKISAAFPVLETEEIDHIKHASELVVFQEQNALPLFVFYL